MTPQTKKLQNRVKAGIVFLDVAEPNWKKKIKLEELDLVNGNYCILGQIFGNYFKGKEKLGINNRIASELGFAEMNKLEHVSSKELKPKYKALTAAWKKILKPMMKRSQKNTMK